MPDEEIVGSYDSASMSMSQYDAHEVDLGVRGLSVRSVYQQIGALQGLGIPIDMNSELFKALRTIVVTNYSILMLQGAFRTLVKAREAREVAMAAGETVAMAAAQQWANIAIATGAAILVSTSLAAGYVVGEKLGSGDWHLPGGNISKPQDRRAMEAGLRATGIREATRHG